MIKQQAAIYIIISAFLLPILLFSLLLTGNFTLGISDIINLIIKPEDADPMLATAVWELRLPRALAAFLAGASLALAGYIFQAIINNPLADPYILGTASGAALGANLTFSGFIPLVIAGVYMPVVSAFAMALIITFLVIQTGTYRGYSSSIQLVLAGVAYSALANALNAVLTFISDSDSKLKSIVFWAMGSLESASLSDCIPLAIALIITALLAFVFFKELFLLSFGTERAALLGLPVQRYTALFLIAATLLTSFTIALTGMIGFVGLLIPHIVRGVSGLSHRLNIILVILWGGMFLMAADLAAKLIYYPTGIPIGVVTMFGGVPFLLYLLRRRGRLIH